MTPTPALPGAGAQEVGDPPVAGGAARWAPLLRVARYGFSFVVIAALAIACVKAAGDISSLSLRVHVGWLVLAWPLALLAFPLLAVAWSQLLMGYGHRLGVAAVVRLWCLAQASRYLPTGLAAVASRAVLAARHGVPHAQSVMTMAVEGALLVAWSSVASAALVLAGGSSAIILFGVAGLLGIGGIPVILLVVGGRGDSASAPSSRLLASLLRLRRQLAHPRLRPILVADLVIGASLVVKAIVFLLFAKALLPVGWPDVALLVGAGNLAVIAGMIGITPAGIGVREGVMAALLSHRFGTANATGLALASRGWDFVVELPWILGSVITSHWAVRRASGMLRARDGDDL